MSDRYYIDNITLLYYLETLEKEEYLLDDIIKIKNILINGLSNYKISKNNTTLPVFNPSDLSEKEIIAKSTFSLKVLLELNKDLKDQIENILYYMKRNRFKKEGVLKK